MSVQHLRVAWPYVTVKVFDENTGSTTVRGFNEGALLPLAVDAADAKRLIGKGALIVDPAPDPPGPVSVFSPPVVAEGRPKDYASKGEWVDYAVSQRADDQSEQDARAEAEAMSKADLIAKLGG